MKEKREKDPRIFKIAHMVSRLSLISEKPKHRIAISLLNYYGVTRELSAVEIATILGVSRTAIHSTIENAVNKLKKSEIHYDQ